MDRAQDSAAADVFGSWRKRELGKCDSGYLNIVVDQSTRSIFVLFVSLFIGDR